MSCCKYPINQQEQIEESTFINHQLFQNDRSNSDNDEKFKDASIIHKQYSSSDENNLENEFKHDESIDSIQNSVNYYSTEIELTRRTTSDI